MTGFQTMFMPRPVLTREPPKMPVVPRERVGLAPPSPMPHAPVPAPIVRPVLEPSAILPPARPMPCADFEELVRRVANRLAAKQFSILALGDGVCAVKFADLLQLVSMMTGFSLLDLQSQRRHAELAKARQIAMWLGRRFTILSMPQIGARLGGRDHTTVLHGQRRVTAVVEHIGPAPQETPQAWIEHLWRAEWPRPSAPPQVGDLDQEVLFENEET